MSASLAFLARHEARLGWRDLISMLTAGRRRRAVRIVVGFALFIVFLHWLSYLVLTSGVPIPMTGERDRLVGVTASVLLAWMLMLSQAMESVTRGFYTRGDLDLILSSPVDARKVFALRVGVNAMLVSFMSVVLVGPAVNVLAFTDSLRWLAGYGVALAMGMTATAMAVALTIALFHLAGPKRTRLIAQVVAAIVGAAFVIGIQAAAILTTGGYSRGALLHHPWLIAHAPAPESLWWWPARAIMGDLSLLAILLVAGAAFFAAVTLPLVGRFGHYATAAASVSPTAARRSIPATFLAMRPAQAMRRKEWMLLKRDPWLISQTLMQLLYLLPPALLLWQDFDANGQGVLVLVPVLVMAAGQLAGGVAWITISAEDAHDLVMTAPLSANTVMAAKLYTVMKAVSLVFVPLVLVLAWEAPWAGFASLAGMIVACSCAALIQLWFRTQSKRSSYRRRHTASRVATFAEAFCCIAWFCDRHRFGGLFSEKRYCI